MEKAISYTQDIARTILLYAITRLPDAVHLSLCLYAMCRAVQIQNTMPDATGGSSRSELFARIAIHSKPEHFHTFGCPVFAMTNDVELGRAAKWYFRSSLGLYLGTLPQHASNVSMVLSLKTVLVSPRFHVSCDDFFDTVMYGSVDSCVKPVWKQLAGIDQTDAIQKRERIRRNMIQDTTAATVPEMANASPEQITTS